MPEIQKNDTSIKLHYLMNSDGENQRKKTRVYKHIKEDATIASLVNVKTAISSLSQISLVYSEKLTYKTF
ncbi:DUF1659 domain-containing protein [Kurthia sibirica]|uniref:DUF1659 domain-containing protein n=1 Tax=Kurthia sibirica TaxID=202750 RepID=A0A2U3ALK1_9BACL|nr:hypothetical protein [Kurthia sibirica]PWI25372.1 hypothetical protein DEX24_08520 [Kurthia sibirica]GEK34611.1 hypothetical protein KSI01_21440 [Kurthia sibirica]